MNELTDNDRPLRGRRLTWVEFEQLTGRPRPVYVAANDNEPKQDETLRNKVGLPTLGQVPLAEPT